MATPTVFPCPACGSILGPEGKCANPTCETNIEQSEGWEPIHEDLTTRTAKEWAAELDLEEAEWTGGDFPADDPERKYTRSDFMRRAGL